MSSIDAIAYEDLLETLSEARKILENAIENGSLAFKEVKITTYGRVWLLDPGELAGRPVSIIGDIHGDVRTLNRVLELSNGAFKVFLGDYVDRGTPEGQVQALYGLLRFLIEKSDTVLLRGNHEPPPGLEPFPHDYPSALVTLYGRDRAVELYRESLELFNLLPHALIINGLALLVHGGIPRKIVGIRGVIDSPEEIARLLGGLPFDLEIVEDILWSDPAPEHRLREGYLPNPRGAGILWSVEMTNRILRMINARVIIRGHETAMAGFKVAHEGKVVTLFTRIGPPYGNTRAAFLYCEDLSKIIDNKGVVNEECVRIVGKS